jgi:DNA-binding XRE family transcriptional regulator
VTSTPAADSTGAQQPPQRSAGGAGPAPWTTVLDGERLRQLRRQRGLSQEKLADRAGVSLTTVARLERQRSPSCRCRTLARLAAALGEHPATIARVPAR